MIDAGLNNKVVIVTGANHGIGEATALAFAQQGANVFINYFRIAPEVFGETMETIGAANQPGRAFYCRKISQSADGIVLKIKSLGHSCYAWEADLGNPENIPKLFDLAEEKLGNVDILVNNAAADRLDTFLPQNEVKKNSLFAEEYTMQSLTSESFDQNFSVNSRGTALMMAEFARRHIERNSTWGRIINISTDGAPGHASNVSYGASKYAIESYTRAAAIELGPYGITVNVVSPGAVQSGWMPKDLEKNLSKTYPMRRIGHPEDIANAITFFASSQADWITGQVLYVGGGNKM